MLLGDAIHNVAENIDRKVYRGRIENVLIFCP
jgi:hypothetical protein